eukprot:scaffold177409_cov33-Tisochrysis_lutea.AAC.2
MRGPTITAGSSPDHETAKGRSAPIEFANTPSKGSVIATTAETPRDVLRRKWSEGPTAMASSSD